MSNLKIIKIATSGCKALFSRPLMFLAKLREYLLFRVKTPLSRMVFIESSGVHLGRNVRIQKLSCLSAERPSASISIGDHSIIYENAQIASYGNGLISLGERAVVGDVRIYSRENISIGARAVFSWNVFIQDFSPHPTDPKLRADQIVSITDNFLPSFDLTQEELQMRRPSLNWSFPAEAVLIGDDVWFGANSTVLAGANIGSGSVVAAGAVVVKGKYPPRSILAGNPARIVKIIE